MQKEGNVSIWLGEFDSEEGLINYTDAITSDNENEPYTSLFIQDYKLKYLDWDFIEIAFNNEENEIEVLFKGVSYSQSFIRELKDKCDDLVAKQYNAVIEVLNYDYSGEIHNTDTTRFIGSFLYDDNSDSI